jgi:hypothetical protein
MASAVTMIQSRSSQAVRRFVGSDIPYVAELHARVWPNPGCPPSIYDDYFRRVFLANPANDPALPSLVSEDESGRVVGFIGVVPRRLVAGGRTYRAAVSSQFVVEPGPEAAFAAARLLRAYLEGSQDVSIADEATDAARALWGGLGGTTAHFLSLHWTRVLRPASFAASFLRARRRCARPRPTGSWRGCAARRFINRARFRRRRRSPRPWSLRGRKSSATRPP